MSAARAKACRSLFLRARIPTSRIFAHRETVFHMWKKTSWTSMDFHGLPWTSMDFPWTDLEILPRKSNVRALRVLPWRSHKVLPLHRTPRRLRAILYSDLTLLVRRSELNLCGVLSLRRRGHFGDCADLGDARVVRSGHRAHGNRLSGMLRDVVCVPRP